MKKKNKKELTVKEFQKALEVAKRIITEQVNDQMDLFHRKTGFYITSIDFEIMKHYQHKDISPALDKTIILNTQFTTNI